MSAQTGIGSKKFDIVIVGAGILGVSVAFWLSELCDCSICLIDREEQVARQTSSRNTGVIHRPYYLDPNKKRVIASAAQKSYYMWSSLAKRYNAPWNQVGTIELSIRESDIASLDRYKYWASANGMEDEEISILDSKQAMELEPEVRCLSAIFSKTDTSVDYGQFSNVLYKLAVTNGVKFLGGHTVVRVAETQNVDSVTTLGSKGASGIECKFLINVAGGSSLWFAHMLHLARNCADLHFRGDYWVVNDPFRVRVVHNIYTVAKYKEFPFLDPHFIVRANGIREIGPNAALVSGPYAYDERSSSALKFVEKLFEKQLTPKFKLLTNRKFLALAWDERKSSASKDEMSKRVREFIPSLSTEFVGGRGMAGIRSSLVDGNGFVPEALQVEGQHSFHILNYNSPGATGAPAFSAYLVKKIKEKGFIDGFAFKDRSEKLWNFDMATDFDLLNRENNLKVSL